MNAQYLDKIVRVIQNTRIFAIINTYTIYTLIKKMVRIHKIDNDNIWNNKKNHNNI